MSVLSSKFAAVAEACIDNMTTMTLDDNPRHPQTGGHYTGSALPSASLSLMHIAETFYEVLCILNHSQSVMG